MIGVLTTFYGYRGDVIDKTRKLIDIFESLDMAPYIQIGPHLTDEKFETVVSELNKLNDRYGVKYSVHQSMWFPAPDFFLNLGSSDARVKSDTLTSLKKSIDFAREIGAKNVSFHAGCAANHVIQKEELEPLTPINPIPYETAYTNVKENLKKLLKHAKKDVKLSIENLNHRPERRYLFSKPQDFQNLVPEVGVLFDAGHAYFSEKKTSAPTYMKELTDVVGGKITEIHVSDNDGLEDQHKLVGFGTVPFQKIFRLISEKQKLPPIIIEAAQAKHNYSENDLKTSIKILAKLVSEVG